MTYTTRERIIQQLMNELDNLLKYHFRQSLDEVVTDLRNHCIIGDSRQPTEILRGIHYSQILNFRKEKNVTKMKEAIIRVLNSTFGQCVICGNSIPEPWLLEVPTTEFCPICVNHRPSYCRDYIDSSR